MKRNSALAFIVALLFTAAAVLSFVHGASFRGMISVIGALSFFLAGIHWRRRGNGRS